MKMLRLFSYFLSGATAVTLAGWGISFTPFAIRVLIYAVVFGLIAIVLSLTFDDPICEYLGVELPTYYAAIGGIAFTLIAGLAVLGGLLW